MTDELTPEQWLVLQGERWHFGDDEVDSRHTPEWAPKEEGGHYLGMSVLVSHTATEYAERIIQKRLEQEPREQRWWGTLGNTLCTAALAPITPHRECQSRVPIGKTGWDRVGHFDGIRYYPFGIVVHEGKAYDSVGIEHKEQEAYRQAVGYLCDVDTMRQNAPITLPLAQFQRDLTAKPFELLPTHEPFGVCLHIFPRSGPDSITPENRPVKPSRVTAENMAHWRSFYDAKCLAIVESVEAGTLDAAMAFDAAHPDEFVRTIYEVGAPLPETADMMHELRDILIALSPREADPVKVKAHEQREKQLRSLLNIAMNNEQAKRLEVPGLRIGRTLRANGSSNITVQRLDLPETTAVVAAVQE
jgi:hypothetical protein